MPCNVHSITTQKTLTRIFTAMKTSNLTSGKDIDVPVLD